jgi:CubicO group peptidase (beta-lactamase class C family)
MVERATGQDWRTFFATEVAPRIGLTTTQFSLPSQRNPRVAAGAVSTVNDMETFLRRLLRGELVRDLEAYRRERTAAATFLSTVTPLQVLRLDWRYGLGFWRECDDATWSSRCASSMVLSSPGGFGSTPWISFDEGYYAMIAMDEQIVAGEPASVASASIRPASANSDMTSARLRSLLSATTSLLSFLRAAVVRTRLHGTHRTGTAPARGFKVAHNASSIASGVAVSA